MSPQTKFNCAKNWRMHNKTCLIYVDHPKSFRIARRDCRMRNGDLVMLETQKKINFVTDELLASDAWVGLRRSSERPRSFVWYIDPQQPLPGYIRSKKQDRCIFLKPNGQLQSTHECSEKRTYICQSQACTSLKGCSEYNAIDRRRRSKINKEDIDGLSSQIRVLPSVKDEEKATSKQNNWALRAQGPLLYLNPVTCSLFIILLTIFLALYVIFIKSLKKSVDQIKEDMSRQRDRTRFIDGSVYCSLPFNA
ncbi:uncharacterized protein LOC121375362 isoform X2 [Gigantopelta aegis]|uniref:uncharacterized protein LOC121375362 isoform X2 n=1 Tax=Gigantopelta aegis TaxID=1735272 RepID=UPI001B88D22D|nr:uncharacterized protein LOC121375362 isoform X2 [Gigantopelta aegis]